jgi:anthranilate phosphoribosyltransferase
MIIDKNFSPIMEQVFAGRSFSADEAEALIHSMIDGTLSDIRTAAVLTGFRFLPLSEDIIIGILKIIKESIIKENNNNNLNNINLVDCSNICFERGSSLNILTIAAIVAAGTGAHVAKFVGTGMTNKSSTCELLESLNLLAADSLDHAFSQIQNCNITFLKFNTVYPTLKHLMEIRKTLGFKTIIDLILPLATPMPLSGQFIGMHSRELLPLMVSCLQKLGRKRAIIAHAEDGLDEISVCSATYIFKLENNKISHEVLNPVDFGIKLHNSNKLLGKDIEFNAQVMLDVLKNQAYPAVMDAVTINAAAILWCAELCADLFTGLKMAKDAISSGKCLKLFEIWKKDCQLSEGN